MAMCLILKKGTCPVMAVYTSNYPSTSHVNMVVLMRYPSGILFFFSTAISNLGTRNWRSSKTHC